MQNKHVGQDFVQICKHTTQIASGRDAWLRPIMTRAGAGPGSRTFSCTRSQHNSISLVNLDYPSHTTHLPRALYMLKNKHIRPIHSLMKKLWVVVCIDGRTVVCLDVCLHVLVRRCVLNQLLHVPLCLNRKIRIWKYFEMDYDM